MKRITFTPKAFIRFADNTIYSTYAGKNRLILVLRPGLPVLVLPTHGSLGPSPLQKVVKGVNFRCTRVDMRVSVRHLLRVYVDMITQEPQHYHCTDESAARRHIMVPIYPSLRPLMHCVATFRHQAAVDCICCLCVCMCACMRECVHVTSLMQIYIFNL